MSVNIKNVNSMIDSCVEDGDGYWIDDHWHFEFNGVKFELLCHHDCYAALTKAELKKEAKHIITTGKSHFE